LLPSYHAGIGLADLLPSYHAGIALVDLRPSYYAGIAHADSLPSYHAAPGRAIYWIENITLPVTVRKNKKLNFLGNKLNKVIFINHL